MKIKIIGDKKYKVENKIISQTLRIISGKIIIFVDGGFGDTMRCYATIKEINHIFPNFSITLLFPVGPFFEFFGKTSLCQLEHKNYQEIYGIMHSWEEKCDIFYNLRPRTFSLYNNSMLHGSEQEEIVKISQERQNNFYGPSFLKSPNSTAEQNLYGSGKIYMMDTINYLHNLNSDFKDAKECFNVNEKYKSFEVPKFKYFTIHQHAYVPGGYNSKFWPQNYWNELARLLKNEYSLPIYQVGAGNEKLIESEFIYNYLGKMNFFESSKFIENSVCHIDIEGSLVHSSALLGNKCVALCGPSSSYWRHPWASNVSYLSLDRSCCDLLPCEDYLKNWWMRCAKEHHHCIEWMKPEMVFEKVKEVVNEN